MEDELYHYGVKGMKWGVRKKIQTGINNARKHHRENKDARTYAKGMQYKASPKARAKARDVESRYRTERSKTKLEERSKQYVRQHNYRVKQAKKVAGSLLAAAVTDQVYFDGAFRKAGTKVAKKGLRAVGNFAYNVAMRNVSTGEIPLTDYKIS